VYYSEHVLIFIYHHGYRPTIVDHKDRDVRNNRIENLRPADAPLNAFNRKLPMSILGVRGVSLTGENRVKRYRAGICYRTKRINLGRFSTLAEAVDARKSAELKYFGETL